MSRDMKDALRDAKGKSSMGADCARQGVALRRRCGLERNAKP